MAVPISGATRTSPIEPRRRVVALQSGDEQTRTIWQQLINVSLAGFNAAYERLGVLLTDD